MVDPTKRRSGKNAERIVYVDIPSSIAPVPHCSELIVPSPPMNKHSYMSNKSESDDLEDLSYDTIYPDTDKKCHFPKQSELNDLIRDLSLTKYGAELLTSRLREWNLLSECVQITFQRKRHTLFSNFYTSMGGLCFCNDVTGLFAEIGISCNPSEWRLFIDSSSRSLKAVLLNNTNNLPSIPLAHSVSLKEDYLSINTLLTALKYEEYGWEVIGDFKMIAFLVGLQGGFIKYQCYLCLWDSRNTKEHYKRQKCQMRQTNTVGLHNVKWKQIIEPHKILLPPLHIKLGLMKQFVKALDQKSEAFKYLGNFFPKLSEAKIKGGVFIGPQIRKMMQDNDFPKLLTRTEKSAWFSFLSVVKGFLGNNREENYVRLVKNLVRDYGKMGCRMSLKVHILDAHLDIFKENMGNYSEEQGERFHQDMCVFENRYQGHYNENMMGEYIWNHVRESDHKYQRNTRKGNHF